MAEKIKYLDVLDYAEGLYFSGIESKKNIGENILKTLNVIEAKKGLDNIKSLSQEDLASLGKTGFNNEDLWRYLKKGKMPEYTSILFDYQKAFADYITNPTFDKDPDFSKRIELFENLKYYEKVINDDFYKNMGYAKYLPLARGEIDINKEFQGMGKFKDIPIIKKVAYGKNGFLSELDNLYKELSIKHGDKMIESLKELESIVKDKDAFTNNIQLYTTCEFVKNKDGKEDLIYTINAPSIKDKSEDIEVSQNESVAFKISENGIEGARYNDYNLYYDELSIEFPNGKEFSGKAASDIILSVHSNDISKLPKATQNLLEKYPEMKEDIKEEYPNPKNIKNLKVDGKQQWVNLLEDMSYPSKDDKNQYTQDYKGITSSIVNNRLKEVNDSIEKYISLEIWKPKEKSSISKSKSFVEKEMSH